MTEKDKKEEEEEELKEEKSFEKNELTKLRRLPARGVFECKQVYNFIDACYYCHVGYLLPSHNTLYMEKEILDEPINQSIYSSSSSSSSRRNNNNNSSKVVDIMDEYQPHIMPCTFGRIDNVIYLKCDKQRLQYNIPLCITFDITDGLVLAKSAFHHSMNYRSAVIFGVGECISGNDKEINEALEAIQKHQLPFRHRLLEKIDPALFADEKIQIVKVPILHASGKQRNGPVGDDKEDLDLPIWSGIVDVNYKLGRSTVSNDNNNNNKNNNSNNKKTLNVLNEWVAKYNGVIDLKKRGLKSNNNMPYMEWSILFWFLIFIIMFMAIYQPPLSFFF